MAKGFLIWFPLKTNQKRSPQKARPAVFLLVTLVELKLLCHVLEMGGSEKGGAF